MTDDTKVLLQQIDALRKTIDTLNKRVEVLESRFKSLDDAAARAARTMNRRRPL